MCVCVCVVCEHMHVSLCVLDFLHMASDPEWSSDCILITGTLHGVTEKTTHTHARVHKHTNTHTLTLTHTGGLRGQG